MSEVKKEGEFSLKNKKTTPKKLTKSDEPIKVDLKKEKQESELLEDNTTKVVIKDEEVEKEKEEVLEEVNKDNEEDVVVIEEVEDTTTEVEEVEKLSDNVEEALKDNLDNGVELPENIQKVVDFMNDTGGSLEDYVRLNADYSKIDDKTLLKEYYKKEKPYLEQEDIDLLLEDFSYDETLDDDIDIRRKKLAFKEEVAKARNFLEQTKSKYYDEVKAKSNVNPEAQKALDFFNRYNQQQKQAEENHKVFQDNTKKLFTENFEGFDINVGEKKYRYKVQNAEKVAEKQSNINNLIGKFLDKNGFVSDYSGYHKAMYAAENIDKIASHFYEQGKADAVKDVVDKSKNLSDSKARPANTGEVFINGLKVKAISGTDSSKLKIKTKKFN